MRTFPAFQVVVLVALLPFLLLAQESARTGVIGTVASVGSNQVILKTDSGANITVQLADDARILRAEPGAKTLAGAQPIAFSEIQPGDRVLARGTASGVIFSATTVVAMKQSDIAKQQQAEEQAWQQRGVSGIVKSVDASTGNITLQLPTFAGTQLLTVKTTNATAIRRYPPDSAKFSDAKPGTLTEIQPGDQLRALGTRSPDGAQLTAEQVVSGSFRNIVASVISADPGGGSLTLLDLSDKKPLTVKISSDSQLRSLPPATAQRLAMRLKGNAGNPVAQPQLAGSATSRVESQGRAPDLQQMISRMPSFNIADLHRGEALMMVATHGSNNSPPTALTVLSGVEPILSAAPSAHDAAMLLSPWILGGGAGEGEAAAGP
jgi:hypothetical protein